MPYTYKSAAYTFNRESGSDTDLTSVAYEHPQPAVDAARAAVREYAGSELPRAVVTRSNGIRGAVIFHAWRSPDGAYHEERVR